MLGGMSRASAAEHWAWQFGEIWHQVAMLQELTPHFEALGIDPRRAFAIGRAKTIRTNQLLMEEMGASIPVLAAYVRFFDARAAWHWPEHVDASLLRRVVGVARAARRGVGTVPTHLTSDPA